MTPDGDQRPPEPPDSPPEYKVYRSRRGLFSRLKGGNLSGLRDRARLPSWRRRKRDEPGLPRLVNSMGPEWAGLSLTMPLKRVALTVADTVSPLAEAVGAANTLVFPAGPAAGRQAHNTDVAGMVAALREAGLEGTARVAGLIEDTIETVADAVADAVAGTVGAGFRGTVRAIAPRDSKIRAAVDAAQASMSSASISTVRPQERQIRWWWWPGEAHAR